MSIAQQHPNSSEGGLKIRCLGVPPASLACVREAKEGCKVSAAETSVILANIV